MYAHAHVFNIGESDPERSLTRTVNDCAPFADKPNIGINFSFYSVTVCFYVCLPLF